MKKKSFLIAFCGMMAALGTVILALGGFLAIATYCAPLIAALLLIAVYEKAGTKAGWAVWLVTCLLSMMLCADKEAVFFYIFIGYYPLVKKYFDGIKHKIPGYAAKVLFFTVSVGAMYFVIIHISGMENVIKELEETGLWMNIIMYIVMVFMLMCYDYLINRGRIILKRKYRMK